MSPSTGPYPEIDEVTPSRRTRFANAASTPLSVPSTLSRVCWAFPPRHILVLPATWKIVSVPCGIAATSEAGSLNSPTASFGRNLFNNLRSEEGRCSAVTSQPRIISSLTMLSPTKPVPPVTKAARAELGGIRGVSRIGLVAEQGRQPTFCFSQFETLALRIAQDLIAVDLANAEIVRLRVGEIKPAHGSSREHGKRLCQTDARGALRIQEPPEQCLLSVLRTGGIPRRWADALILFADQSGVVQVFARRVG